MLPPTDRVNLYRADVGDLLEMLRRWGVRIDFVHMDAPWQYRNFSATVNGAAAGHYDGLPMEVIAEHMAATYDLVAQDAYLACWVTFPKLMEWAAVSHLAGKWEYVTGGAWGKTNGLGVGFHMRGDSELLLLYKKGSPQPHATVSNFWPTPRIGHSEKPQRALRALIAMATVPGSVVLDLYAGASASCARACRALGRDYVGSEIDAARHAEAMRRLSLAEQSSFGLEDEVASDIELVS